METIKVVYVIKQVLLHVCNVLRLYIQTKKQRLQN